MNSRHRLPGLMVLLVSILPAVAAAAGPSAGPGRLRELGATAGRWVYHGDFRVRAGAPAAAWTWHADCGWAANGAFMVCSFANTWAGRHVNSVVVDTYDRRAHTFWHYEVFNSGRSAGRPFATKMQIHGRTWIESWRAVQGGKPVRERIVYRFASAERVRVWFQRSSEGRPWRTTASGVGTRVAPAA